MKMICFDMDGTIADLYGQPGWLEALLAEDPAPYINAAPLTDMDALRNVLVALINQGWEIRVISWLAKDSSESYKKAVRQAKKEWLARYNFPAEKVHLTAYGTTKANAIRKGFDRSRDTAILIDDNETVRDGWHMGEAIDPAAVDLLEYLENLAD